MNKIFAKNIKVVFLIITIFLLIVIRILNMYNLYIFVGSINQTMVTCSLCLVLLGLVFFLLKGDRLIFRFLLVTSMFVVLSLMIWDYKKSQDEVYIFKSPDKSYTLLVNDKKYTEFYYKKGPLLYQLLRVDLAVSSSHSFKDNLYTVTWIRNDTVELNYLLFSDSYVNIIFDLKNPNQIFKAEW